MLDGIGEAGATVIVDPIDGTWNYANGIAVFGVIVSVVEDGETTFGLLYDPIGDDWIAARKGAGAWFRGAGRSAVPVRASAGTGALEDTFGFVGIYLYSKDEQALIAVTLPRFRRTQSLRCSCHEYLMLTSGRAAFALNGMLNPWDHAAGVLCLREAGGVARLLDGTEYAPSMTEGRLLAAASVSLSGTNSPFFTLPYRAEAGG